MVEIAQADDDAAVATDDDVDCVRYDYYYYS